MIEHEIVNQCRYCGSDAIEYVEVSPHIEARCGYCNRFLKYVKQLDLDYWKRKVKERDRYTCQRCGALLEGRAAHAHHKIPTWFIPSLELDIDNGITLCGPCHRQIHGKGGTIKEDGDINLPFIE